MPKRKAKKVRNEIEIRNRRYIRKFSVKLRVRGDDTMKNLHLTNVPLK